MPARQGGFSIIELSVALTIVAVLMALGMPSLAGYLQNARLGNTAKGFQAGLSLARAEAIRRNGTVEFAITSSPIASGVENSLVTSTSGQNWVVRFQSSASAPYQLVEAKSILEGGGATPSITVAASSPIFTFNSLGGTTSGVRTGIRIENPFVGQCAPVGPVRCWQVQVSPAGEVRLCDPAAAAGDSRACGP